MNHLSEIKMIAFLDGEVTANEAKEIEQVLRENSFARAQFERLQLIRRAIKPAVAPGPVSGFKARVFSQIHHSQRPRVGLRFTVALACTVILAMTFAVLFFLLRSTSAVYEHDSAFTPRSATGKQNALTRLTGVDVYLHENSDPLNRKQVEDNMTFGPMDGFSFVVHNRTNERCYLAIFGTDATGKLHWFYPSGNMSPYDSESIPVAASPVLFPLPDGVSPGEVADGRFLLMALMTHQPQTVETLTTLMGRGGKNRLRRQFPDASLQVLRLIARAAGQPSATSQRNRRP
ncbi:MAG: hypothetical protein JXR76_21100 [Deltaproteobacteria bacterium]|nr:hypothetical protein [Deltaproteobacteria bacterium]